MMHFCMYSLVQLKLTDNSPEIQLSSECQRYLGGVNSTRLIVILFFLFRMLK